MKVSRSCFLLLSLVTLLLAACSSDTTEAPPEQALKPFAYSVTIPMRDGEGLPTDIYLPHEGAKDLPCILVRAPSGRDGYSDAFAPMAKWGYAVAVQDTRMVIDEQGKALPYMSDGWGNHQDGYDTVEWLAEQDFCNGKVGTMGNSALGITQLLMAPTAPPHLTCQFIGNAAPSIYHYAVYNGGQLRTTQVQGWLCQYSKNEQCMALIRKQPEYNPFWARIDALPHAHKVKVPGVHVGGWFDTFLQGTIDAYTTRQEQGDTGARGTQKLVIGPWTHFTHVYEEEDPQLGDFTIPEMGREVHLPFTKKDWLDYHLKGVENCVAQLKPVTYYVMGPLDDTPSKGNVWRQANTWPVPARDHVLYLSADGQLGEFEPSDEDIVLSYSYDPDDPTPTIGGRNLFLESGPKDQQPIEARDDVIVFTSAALEEDLEVTGRVQATVYIETDCVDTDVAVRLCDVYPDGRSVLISDGITRLQTLTKGKAASEEGVLEVDIDLWSTSVVFAKGHRLRVSVSSANYPRFERNLNIGHEAEMSDDPMPEVAHNKIHLSKTRPSRITLPVPEEV